MNDKGEGSRTTPTTEGWEIEIRVYSGEIPVGETDGMEFPGWFQWNE